MNFNTSIKKQRIFCAEQLIRLKASIGEKIQKPQKLGQLYVGLRNGHQNYDPLSIFRQIEIVLGFLQKMQAANASILFVNMDPKFTKLIKTLAHLLQQPYVNESWVGGLLTNWNHLQNSVKSWIKFETHISPWCNTKGVLFPKRWKAKHRFEGLQQSSKRPDVIMVFQAAKAAEILHEAKTCGIPTIGFGVNEQDSFNVDYPIHRNTVSMKFMHAFCNRLHIICTNNTKQAKKSQIKEGV